MEMREDLEGSAVLFDLDGTLVDTAADLTAAMNYALSQSGIEPLRVDQVRHLVGHGSRAMLVQGFELSTGMAADQGTLDVAQAIFLDHYMNNIAIHSAPFDGVLALIEALRDRGVKMGICTNKPEAMARLLVESLNIDTLFESIVGGETAGVAKPDPAPVKLCLKQTGASRAIFVGDSDTDIRAAQATGLPCLLVEFGYGPTTLQIQANAIIRDYKSALPVFLKALTQN